MSDSDSAPSCAHTTVGNEPIPRRGLSQRWFVDESIFDRELGELFSNSWLACTSDSGLESLGDCRTVDVSGHKLLLLRDAQGTLRCLSNVCRHRGCQLITADTTRTPTSIRCPYHGWTYHQDGRLAAAPNMANDGSFEPLDHGLPAFVLDAWAHQYFVNASGTAPPLSQWLAPISAITSQWFASPLRLAKRIDYGVAANWKLLFQNYNECYHCRFVHPGLNALTSFDTASNDLSEGPILGGPMLLNEDAESMSVDGRRCGDLLPDLDSEQARRVYYFTLFPNLFVSPHPDYVMIHRLFPESPMSTRIECEFWFADSSFGRADFDPQPAVDFWDEVNRQDWSVCEATHRGISSRNYRPGPFSESESMVAQFDRYYRSVFAGHDEN